MAGMDGGVELKEFMQGFLFLASQVTGSFSQGMDDEALPSYGLLGLFAEFHEVVLYHSYDVEAVGDDFGIGEAFSNDGPVAGAQVHAKHLYLFSVFITFQGFFYFDEGFALDDVVDAVVTQVGNSGGEFSPFVDGVFVDDDHEGSGVVQGFFDFEMESFVDDAFNGTWECAEFVGNGFVVNVFYVFVCDGVPE